MPADSCAAPLAILFQDSELIVVDKPAGLASQPDRTGKDDLLAVLSRQLGISPAALLPVHRLDRPVSGLLAVARTPAAQTALTRQLADHEMGKTYHCVVCGIPVPPAGELMDLLSKNERLNLSRVVNPGSASAKQAVLSYRTAAQIVSAEGQELALLQVELQTGRHHQIRVQLAHAGWPIWGDTKYNPALLHAGGWHALALCATGIRFRHPRSGREYSFSRPLPDSVPFSLFSGSVPLLCDKMKEQEY